MDNKNNNNKNDNKNNKNVLVMLIVGMAGLLLFSFLSRSLFSRQSGAITYDDFLVILKTKNVKEVVFDEIYNRITAQVEEEGRIAVYSTAIVDEDSALDIIKERNIKYSGTVVSSNSWISIVLYALFAGFMIYWMISMRSGGGLLGGMGKSNAKVYVQKETGVSFADVAGQDEAMESLVELVDFLHNP
ncbi:MAG: AAA family ATPase, partial [Lachnospiraceae bacterium]|nr:AAA family ATPase [Lachnospiraceae bacterium]